MTEKKKKCAVVDFTVSIYLDEDEGVEDMTEEEIIERAVELHNEDFDMDALMLDECQVDSVKILDEEPY